MLTVTDRKDSDASEASEHSVRFYERDAVLLDEVADFLDAALRAGGLAVAIASAEHRVELHRKLCGIAGPAAGTAAWFPGSLVLLDAAETLDLFMVESMPDAARFEAAIGPVVCGGPAGKPVHAFGEMVAVLCERGNYEGALRLEALWNDLAARHRFSLFCAYPKRLFAQGERLRVFQHVCRAHTMVRGVLDVSPDAADADVVLQLRAQAVVLQAEVERRRHAEQTLRQRERELAAFLDNASEGIHKVAADGTILYANRAELELLGYRWDEYVGHNIADFYVDPTLIEDILVRLKRGEILRDQPALLRCKDGSFKPVLIYSDGYLERGDLVYTRCFTRDASERVAREQALEQRNNLIVQSPVGAALITGPELRFELANEAYCRMVGQSDIAGKTFAQAFPSLQGSESEQQLRQVMATGEAVNNDEHGARIDIGNGVEERFYRRTLQPLRRPDGGVEGVMVVAVDVTEHVRARRALEQAAAEREQLLASAREASRAKDEFLAMLGHELRNPLSPIVTALQLMKMRGETGTGREQDIIRRQVDHMVRLVDDLLDISRVTRGKIELQRERCEVSAVLAKAVEQASLLLEQRSHTLHVDVPAGLTFDCDPVRMAQVIANLLTNAARYTDIGGQIHLSAKAGGDEHLAISVRDNGSGIDAELLPRVFELFYQGGRGVDRAEGGLGIGLALVRSLVEQHGGTVEARSEGKGRGSEFIVRLPWRRADAAGTAPASQVDPQPVANGARVLLVDDNRDAAETMAQLLRLYGYQLEVFHDPVSALAALDRVKPDVAILDIGLPVMDGYELGRCIRQQCGAACTLVALTGYGQDTDRARSDAAGFDHHLVKPVALEALVQVLGSVK